MFVHTAPREIAARWIGPGDEVATYEVEDGSGEADSGKRDFIRTAEFAERFSSPEWWLVIDHAALVAPGPDAEDPGHTGWFNVATPAVDRGFVPDDLEVAGAVSLVLAPIVNGRLDEPRIYFAKDEEQFVIRERVKVAPRALRLLTPLELAEGQRASAGSTVAAAKYNELLVPRDAWLSGYSEGGRNAREAFFRTLRGARAERRNILASGVDEVEERGSVAGDATVVLPTSRIPLGVLGVPHGRTVVDSDAVDFRSKRESEEA